MNVGKNKENKNGKQWIEKEKNSVEKIKQNF